MSNEAQVLKEIREERKHRFGCRSFSVRAVAKRLHRSNAWLSHIENGRADVPSDHRLDALLAIYGLKRKSFIEQELGSGEQTARSAFTNKRQRPVANCTT